MWDWNPWRENNPSEEITSKEKKQDNKMTNKKCPLIIKVIPLWEGSLRLFYEWFSLQK